MLSIQEIRKIKGMLSHSDDELMNCAMQLYNYFRSGRYSHYREWHPFGFMFGVLCGVTQDDLMKIRYAWFAPLLEEHYVNAPLSEDTLEWRYLFELPLVEFWMNKNRFDGAMEKIRYIRNYDSLSTDCLLEFGANLDNFLRLWPYGDKCGYFSWMTFKNSCLDFYFREKVTYADHD